MLKIKSILSTLLILALTALPALSEGFHHVEKDGKFALADDTGFLLTDYIYDDIYCYDTEPPFRTDMRATSTRRATRWCPPSTTPSTSPSARAWLPRA